MTITQKQRLSKSQKTELLAERLLITNSAIKPKLGILDKPFEEFYLDFKKKFWVGYEHTLFQAEIDKRLSKIAQYILTDGKEGINRLMIFMPPRHGKTENISKMFPSAMLGLDPRYKILLCSYSNALPNLNSKGIRSLVGSNKLYRTMFPHTQLDPVKYASIHWETLGYGGGVKTAGVGTGIAGFGATIGIIDDPVKNREEAESQTIREQNIAWYQSDFSTRIEEPKGVQILMMTRWHPKDLAGWILENERELWDVLELPAIAGINDPLGRKEGEPLWFRYGIPKLEQMRKTLGEYAFQSLYQQRPITHSKILFPIEKFTIVENIPDCSEIVRYWDFAVTKQTYSDYTVGLKIGKTKDKRYVVLDMWREQTYYAEIKPHIIRLAKSDTSNCKIRLEKDKTGLAILENLSSSGELDGFNYAGTPMENKDKQTRASMISPIVMEGRVLVLRGHWNKQFFEEVGMYPQTDHDDIVDTFCGGINELIDNNSVQGGGIINFQQVLREAKMGRKIAL